MRRINSHVLWTSFRPYPPLGGKELSIVDKFI